MLIDTTLLVKNTEIVKGLLDGTLKRYGSVIRESATGRIVKHLAEAPGLTNKLMTLPFSPVLTGVSLLSDLFSNFQLKRIDSKLTGIETTLSPMLGVTQIAAGASVLNLGVSIAGFAYMGYKLNQLQKSLGNIQQTLETGFNDVNTRFDQVSGQLAYLCLLADNNRQKQQQISEAIANLHKSILIKEISDLAAEILDRSRFPDSSPRETLKVASRVRLFLANQAMQATPELDAEILLNSDVSMQGWAVATATEANLLLEIGKIEDAKELLALEVPKFQEVAVEWTDHLIIDENPFLATAYRFTAPCFEDYISSERVERIVNFSEGDRSLSRDQIRCKKNEVEVEFQMSYSQAYDQAWIHRQIAIAEYLDTLSELSARLDSLQSFAALCESRNVKSSKEILPNAESGLYVLS